ncbi:MAG TPA: winged helix-turn-helix domain-containing protein [Candidatus Wallbacteria bacterium]|nr:winged helix-turn-helix domain-containing protein [Candidatus Wallbacteria bacterium]
MEAYVGNLAGSVWQYLDKNGPTGFKQLKKSVLGNEKEDISMASEKLGMAIGWLLKEGKISVIESGTGKGYRVTFELKK